VEPCSADGLALLTGCVGRHASRADRHEQEGVSIAPWPLDHSCDPDSVLRPHEWSRRRLTVAVRRAESPNPALPVAGVPCRAEGFVGFLSAVASAAVRSVVWVLTLRCHGCAAMRGPPQSGGLRKR